MRLAAVWLLLAFTAEAAEDAEKTGEREKRIDRLAEVSKALALDRVRILEQAVIPATKKRLASARARGTRLDIRVWEVSLREHLAELECAKKNDPPFWPGLPRLHEIEVGEIGTVQNTHVFCVDVIDGQNGIVRWGPKNYGVRGVDTSKWLSDREVDIRGICFEVSRTRYAAEPIPLLERFDYQPHRAKFTPKEAERPQPKPKPPSKPKKFARSSPNLRVSVVKNIWEIFPKPY